MEKEVDAVGCISSGLQGCSPIMEMTFFERQGNLGEIVKFSYFNIWFVNYGQIEEKIDSGCSVGPRSIGI